MTRHSCSSSIYSPIVPQRQILSKQTVQKNVRIPRRKLVDVHVATQREAPTVQRVETVGGQKAQFGNEVVDVSQHGHTETGPSEDAGNTAGSGPDCRSGQGHSTGTGETRRRELQYENVSDSARWELLEPVLVTGKTEILKVMRQT